jgi:hemerythrin-like domain-containing protein
MHDATDELRRDHLMIEQVVAGMSALADLLDSGKQVTPAVLSELVHFFNTLVPECQAKEEQWLFPLLAAKASISSARLRELERFEDEHRMILELVDTLTKISALYLENPLMLRYQLTGVLRRIAELYPAHIWKEDNLLFPTLQQVLSKCEQDELRAKFDNVAAENSAAVPASFEALAEELAIVVEYRNAGACPLCSAAA